MANLWLSFVAFLTLSSEICGRVSSNSSGEFGDVAVAVSSPPSTNALDFKKIVGTRLVLEKRLADVRDFNF